MVFDLISSLLTDYLLLLKQDPSFFSLSKEQKKTALQEAWKSDAFAALSELSLQNLEEEIRYLLQMMKQETSFATPSLLLKALANYFLQEFWKHFDHLNRDFYLLPEEEQKKKLESLFVTPPMFSKQLRKILLNTSAQDISEEIVSFLHGELKGPRIIVQSPVECDLKTKEMIRHTFLKDYPKSFLFFSVNRQLIGGIRFFVDGKVSDLSWFSKIQSLYHFSSHL